MKNFKLKNTITKVKISWKEFNSRRAITGKVIKKI